MERGYSDYSFSGSFPSYSQSQSGALTGRRGVYSARGRFMRAARFATGRRRLPMYRSIASRARDSVIICRTAQNNYVTSADAALGIGCSLQNVWINGVSTIGYAGASDIYNLYDVARVVKFTVDIMFDYNSADVSNTGTPGLPIVYTAFDPTDNSAPTLNSISQYSTCRIAMVGDAKNGNRVTRTVYPKLQQTQGAVALLTNANQWVETASDIPSNGLKVLIDHIGTPNVNRYYMIVVKVWIECKIAK